MIGSRAAESAGCPRTRQSRTGDSTPSRLAHWNGACGWVAVHAPSRTYALSRRRSCRPPAIRGTRADRRSSRFLSWQTGVESKVTRADLPNDACRKLTPMARVVVDDNASGRKEAFVRRVVVANPFDRGRGSDECRSLDPRTFGKRVEVSLLPRSDSAAAHRRAQDRVAPEVLSCTVRAAETVACQTGAAAEDAHAAPLAAASTGGSASRATQVCGVPLTPTSLPCADLAHVPAPALTA